jgi:hypothetical protein
MTVMENVTTKKSMILVAVMKKSTSIAAVLLFAAFITKGALFDSTLVRGIFAWACLIAAISLIVFILDHLKLSAVRND